MTRITRSRGTGEGNDGRKKGQQGQRAAWRDNDKMCVYVCVCVRVKKEPKR